MAAETDQQLSYGTPVALTEGPLAGWMTWGVGLDPYETHLGPFCFREIGGRVQCAFIPRREHLNGGGAVHGGALMGFADFALFAIANRALKGEHAVTLTFNSEFVSAGDLDGMIEAEGDVLRNARSVVFVRGIIRQRDTTLLAFSGTLKKITPKPRE